VTKQERKAAIEAHRIAHENKIVRARTARLAKFERNRKRGLQAAIASMKERANHNPVIHQSMLFMGRTKR
jgi:hypothetical protein